MATPQRGEVLLVDLGVAAKVRPALVLSIPAGDTDRALVTLVPHTTSVRGSRFEVAVPVQFLRPGAFDAQSLVTIPLAKLKEMKLTSVERIGRSQLSSVRWTSSGGNRKGAAMHRDTGRTPVAKQSAYSAAHAQ